MDINQLIKKAILAKDSVRLSSLRAVKSAFLVAQTQKGASVVDDTAKQKIIQKLVKQRKDAAEIYLEQNPKIAEEIESAIRTKAGLISKKIEGNPSPKEEGNPTSKEKETEK